MKIGDKLICKKTHIYGIDECKIRHNFSYTISDIVSNNNVNSGVNVGFWICVEPWSTRYLLNDWFYTVKELRKLKLETISK